MEIFLLVLLTFQSLTLSLQITDLVEYNECTNRKDKQVEKAREENNWEAERKAIEEWLEECR